MNTYKWLLKREFWEHKGGFFWTPAVVGALMTLFLAISMTIGVTVKNKHGMQINGEQVTSLSKVVSPEEVEVDLAPNVRVRVLRSTISTVLAKPDPAAAREAARDKDKAKDKEPAREADKV